MSAELTEADQGVLAKAVHAYAADFYTIRAAVESILTARLAAVEAERDEWAEKANCTSVALIQQATAAITEERDAAEQQLADLRASITAQVTGPTVTAWRNEAARGQAELPYASNRYVRLVDDLRALLDDPAPSLDVRAQAKAEALREHRCRPCGCGWCCANTPTDQRGATHKRTCQPHRADQHAPTTGEPS